MKDLGQLKKLNDFVDDAALIRDVSRVKQVCCIGVPVFTELIIAQCCHACIVEALS